MKLQKVVVHLRVQPPSHPLQTTVMDYAFDQCLGWGPGERSAPPVDDDGDDDGSLDISGSGPDSDGGAPPAATTSA
jgi:hypothetical protein